MKKVNVIIGNLVKTVKEPPYLHDFDNFLLGH